MTNQSDGSQRRRTLRPPPPSIGPQGSPSGPPVPHHQHPPSIGRQGSPSGPPVPHHRHPPPQLPQQSIVPYRGSTYVPRTHNSVSGPSHPLANPIVSGSSVGSTSSKLSETLGSFPHLRHHMRPGGACAPVPPPGAAIPPYPLPYPRAQAPPKPPPSDRYLSRRKSEHAQNSPIDPNVYPCTQCSDVFDRASALPVHMEKCHKKQRSFTCDCCGSVHASRSALTRHRNHAHSDRRF